VRVKVGGDDRAGVARATAAAPVAVTIAIVSIVLGPTQGDRSTLSVRGWIACDLASGVDDDRRQALMAAVERALAPPIKLRMDDAVPR
jgi:hypothetical protein